MLPLHIPKFVMANPKKAIVRPTFVINRPKKVIVQPKFVIIIKRN